VNYKNLFKKTYTGEKSSYEIFEKWAKSRNIIQFIKKKGSWKQITKNGIRGKFQNRGYEGFPLSDHTSVWKNETGKKILISQPYAYYPGDMMSCFAPPNIHYEKGKSEEDSRKNFTELKIWCKERNLEVKFYDSTNSWYYPHSTILIEIREKE
jgi:hypothetical protein